MKHLILAMALTLVGCGGGSSTPTTIETVKEVFVPGDTVTVTEPGEVETVYVVQECPEVVEPTDTVEPEIVTFYLQSTVTLDGETTREVTYDDKGFTQSIYSPQLDRLSEFTYDERDNQTSFIVKDSGVVTQFTYTTYNENDDVLTRTRDNNRSEIYTYDESYHLVKSETDHNGDGVYHTIYQTWEGDNLVKIDDVTYNKVTVIGHDEFGNIISTKRYEDNILTQTYTYTWQEFTEEIK